MRRALLLGIVVALAAGAPRAQEGEKPAAPAGEPKKDTGTMGALSEEEFKALHDLTDKEPPAPKGKMVDLGGDARAYLSLPEGSPPFPGLLVIHEWWGLNRHIQHYADRFAAEGYAALAVDLYEGKVADNRGDASRYMQAVNETRAREVLKRAHVFLKENARVKATKRGSIGWCFGGGWSLSHAIATPDLDAAVIYYGRLVLDPEILKAIRAPVLGIFGNRDTSFTPELVDQFEKALAAAGVSHRILRYDADHAFANPSGGRYDQKAAAAAWEQVRAFLAERLK
jgi:carboxymethylenebutenolidase